MKKPDSKIFRYGDYVRIINPIFVSRVGYPLTIEDGKKMVMEDKYLSDRLNELTFKIGLEKEARDYDKLMNIMAYWHLKKMDFGGNNRDMYTFEVPSAKGHIFEVINKKVVCVGTRYRGRMSGNPWLYDSDDYEPPSLYNAKTHILIHINDGSYRDCYFIGNSLRDEGKATPKHCTICNYSSCYMIEDINIEKVDLKKIREMRKHEEFTPNWEEK